MNTKNHDTGASSTNALQESCPVLVLGNKISLNNPEDTNDENAKQRKDQLLMSETSSEAERDIESIDNSSDSNSNSQGEMYEHIPKKTNVCFSIFEFYIYSVITIIKIFHTGS